MSLEQSELGFEAGEALGGFRLYRFELLNWGTFNGQIRVMAPNGENTLLTGENGSGKSTIVDAITTLLVPPQLLAFNKSAGAEHKERSLNSYVEGVYKSAREDDGGAARRVGLRQKGGYSVLLGYFFNQALNAGATLAQVYWKDEGRNNPARFYVFSERNLSIKEHFSGFGSDIKDLKRKLRDLGIEAYDHYKEYFAKFGRFLGIESEQAISLFNQTVSMKNVNSITDFVRSNMLEKPNVAERIDALKKHFNDLVEARDAVRNAKKQIEMLLPIREDGEKYDDAVLERKSLEAALAAVDTWLATYKTRLLEERLKLLKRDAEKLKEALAGISSNIDEKRREIARLEKDIESEGGGRLEQLERDIAATSEKLAQRKKRAEDYSSEAAALSITLPQNADEFVENRARLKDLHAKVLRELERIDNSDRETYAEKVQLDKKITDCREELESLKRRKTNIEAKSVNLRSRIAQSLAIDEEELPFAGELIAVRKEEERWEGAAERLLRNFALSMLVQDALYKKVSDWVDENNLNGRLVYFRVSESENVTPARIAPRTLAAKLELKKDSPFYAWLSREVAARFDYICCDTMDEFRREKKAVTARGQSKQKDGKHEKDDRSPLHDRSRYVLGWNNAQKISLLEEQEQKLRKDAAALAATLAELKKQRQEHDAMVTSIAQLSRIEAFAEIDWQSASRELLRLQDELDTLKASSQKLQALKERQEQASLELKNAEAEYAETLKKQGANEDEISRRQKQLKAESEYVTEELVAFHEAAFARLDALLAQKAGLNPVSLENCEEAKKEISKSLQDLIKAAGDSIEKIGSRIAREMTRFKDEFVAIAQDFTADASSLKEYKELLAKLEQDDLPRFEARFNKMLKQETIEDMALFNGYLGTSAKKIQQRIECINGALRQIEYNPDTYIKLEVIAQTPDKEIRQFKEDMKECTRDAFAGEDAEYTAEARFAAIEKILVRFRGRDGFSAEDERWKEKVTDVRNWFTFAASERYTEDGKEAEHYSDSSGKSGGQKEKLAYTVLAAGLAYQYGLYSETAKGNTFRFVMIDEAFMHSSDESARYALELFRALNLQLLLVTPTNQKTHIIEPFVSVVAFVTNRSGNSSQLMQMTIEEFRRKQNASLDNGG